MMLDPTANGGNGSVKVLLQACGSHQVAFDPITNEGFVPFGGVVGDAGCSDGCVAVFAETTLLPEPVSLLLLLSGFAALIGLSSHRR